MSGEVVPIDAAARRRAEEAEADRVGGMLGVLSDITGGVLDGSVRGFAVVVLRDSKHVDVCGLMGEIDPVVVCLLERLRERCVAQVLGDEVTE